MKWYQDDSGTTSAMRIMAMIVCFVGVSVVIAGGVALFMKYGDAIQMMGIGTSLVTFSLGLKVLQKNIESKNE